MWTPNKQMAALGTRDGWQCTYCEVPLAHLPEHLIERFSFGEFTYSCEPGWKFPQVDHVIPKSRGGGAGLWNRVLACPSCNASKGNRTAEAFLLDFIGERRVAPEWLAEAA